MEKDIVVKSPAKINLHLEVKGVREDGYHDIVSLFQTVSIYDTLKFRSLKKRSDIRISGNHDIPDHDNIIKKAFDVFVKKTGINTGVDLELEKHIPVQAGLGGGSSDAASTLIGLNTLFKAGLTDKEMMELSQELGSDVPFFISGPAAVVTGRGEKVEPVQPRSDYWIVIIYPDIRVETKTAYQWIDEYRCAEKKPRFTVESLIEKYKNPVNTWPFYNDFNAVLLNKFNVYSKLEEILEEKGACFSCVSGSGSSLFGIFNSENDAEEAKMAFIGEYPLVTVARPLDKKIQPVLL
ncbi:MAG: 4-(cytidine 5'-diphospho)-2-C-methyl-D-erythritol kinase [Spirochaetales bacterium]|nr:4-(cytidine 5'-diphospho)-2-C-methyl-D-erythritol kinase [Spirochaetales bacterium]